MAAAAVLYEVPAEYDVFAEFETCPTCAGELDGAECATCDGGNAFDLEPFFRELAGDIEARALALAKMIHSVEAEAALIEAHIDALAVRAAARRSRADTMKTWLRLTLEAGKLKRVRDPFVSVWLQRSAPSIRILDAEKVPLAFKRATLQLPAADVPPELAGAVKQTDIMKTDIMQHFTETGEVVEGTEYVRDAEHLRIKA